MFEKKIFIFALVSVFADILTRFLLNITLYNKLSGILCLAAFFICFYKGVSTLVNVLFSILIARYIFLLIDQGYQAADLYDLFAMGFSSLYLTYLSSRRPNKNAIQTRYVEVTEPWLILLVLTLILFAPTFFDLDFYKSGAYEVNVNDIESIREYRSGLFPIPQMPAYFFFFSACGMLAVAKYKGKLSKFLLFWLSGATLVLSFIVGSRVPIYSIAVLSGVYFFLSRGLKRKFYFIIVLIAVIFVYFNIDSFLSAFDNTIFYQYFTFTKTASENYERLSRYIIWYSWFNAVSDFDVLDYIFGVGFNSSILLNEKNIGYPIWFHNDILSIFFSWGFIGLIFYSYPFLLFYRRFKRVIFMSLPNFILFFSMHFMAITNGLYLYYSPIFYYVCYRSFIYVESINARD